MISGDLCIRSTPCAPKLNVLRGCLTALESPAPASISASSAELRDWQTTHGDLKMLMKSGGT